MISPYMSLDYIYLLLADVVLALFYFQLSFFFYKFCIFLFLLEFSYLSALV